MGVPARDAEILMSTFFRAVLLSLASAALATPAHSEIIDVTCASAGDSGEVEMRVGGRGPFKTEPYAATISAQYIRYEGRFPGNQNYEYTATLDRVAGTLVSGRFGYPQTYACRRGTQKF